MQQSRRGADALGNMADRVTHTTPVGMQGELLGLTRRNVPCVPTGVFFTRQEVRRMTHKTNVLRFRVTREERVTVERLAARECQNLSEWLRAAIRRDARANGLWPPETVARQGQPMP